jgi:hypothetical protein
MEGVRILNIQEFAKMLDGRSEDSVITLQEENKAAQLGFVVVYGYSDDNAEFAGAISDEVGCYDGGTIHLSTGGIFEDCDSDCKYALAAKGLCKIIEAKWNNSDGEYAWTYETDIPHETFNILDEEGNKWCKGIVFDIKSLQ